MTAWRASRFDIERLSPTWLLCHSSRGFLTQAGDALFHTDDPLIHTLAGRRHALGEWQGAPVALIEGDETAEVLGTQWLPLRPLMLQATPAVFKLFAYASQIATWVRQHRYCGQCGERTTLVPGQWAATCPVCGLTAYPRLSPSMIALVTRGDEVLLARSPRFAAGVYSTLAGFVEPGESVEACVHREIWEEVGIRVGRLRYCGSQNWPYPHSLMLGYHVDYLSGDIRCQPEEIEDARWFAVDALPPLPNPFSIARYLIERYVAERSGAPEPVLPD